MLQKFTGLVAIAVLASSLSPLTAEAVGRGHRTTETLIKAQVSREFRRYGVLPRAHIKVTEITRVQDIDVYHSSSSSAKFSELRRRVYQARKVQRPQSASSSSAMSKEVPEAQPTKISAKPGNPVRSQVQSIAEPARAQAEPFKLTTRQTRLICKMKANYGNQAPTGGTLIRASHRLSKRINLSPSRVAFELNKPHLCTKYTALWDEPKPHEPRRDLRTGVEIPEMSVAGLVHTDFKGISDRVTASADAKPVRPTTIVDSKAKSDVQESQMFIKTTLAALSIAVIFVACMLAVLILVLLVKEPEDENDP